ncbi:MAG TPA: hypothetical protein VD862_01025 [Candidatus Paceibacterota bacterium]|nr:hypothetical protein [Candidatus Paceibacterota bacterium]
MENAQLEQQIADLEQELAAKRQALESGGTERMPSDEELVHRSVGEKIQQKMPSYQPAPQPSGGTASWQDPAIAQQVQTLVNIAFSKGMDDAIAEAVKSGNAALIDAFHDLLRDQLVAELAKRGKFNPAE